MGVYEALGIEPIINAAGTLTYLSGSRMLPEVADAMVAASHAFVHMDELHLAAGRRIAELIGVEAAHVCAGAAAGITLMAAACMAGSDPLKIARLPETSGMKNKFIVQKSHRNPFDQALRLAGGEFIEIEPDAKELEKALNAQTAAVYYTIAWFCPGAALPLPQVAEIAHRSGVPVIVDAAAEIPPVQNLTRFVKEGADLVAFSGGKVLRGPQSSGFILGRQDLVEACRLNDNPHMGVGRPMKVSKEEIVGLVKAIEIYISKDHDAEMALWERRVAYIIEALADLDMVCAWRQLPYGIGQQIPHVAMSWDEKAVGLTYIELTQRLLAGKPRIAVQLVAPESYYWSGYKSPQIRIHPHTLQEGEEIIVAQRVREVFVTKQGLKRTA